MDVNERAREEWVMDTTPGERVRSIMRRTYDPQSVAEIAERALVSTGEAREHIDALSEVGFVEEVDDGRYRRNHESIVRERAEQILDEIDVETLEERVAELRDTVCGLDGGDGESVESKTAHRNLIFAEAALDIAEGE